MCTLIVVTTPLDMNIDMLREKNMRDDLSIGMLCDDVSPGFSTLQSDDHLLAKSS